MEQIRQSMIEERGCFAANWRLCTDLSTCLAGHMASIVTLRYAHVYLCFYCYYEGCTVCLVTKDRASALFGS